MSQAHTRQAEKRNLLASFFITLLIGIAFQDMTSTVRESVREELFGFEDICLLLSFFLIAVRFFVGNQLHLLSDAFVRLPGIVWLYDLVMIIGQTTVLVFLGGLTSLHLNVDAQIGFVDLMVILYVMDVLWIVSQWAMAKVDSSWTREMIPWQWAVLNSVLVLVTVILYFALSDLYSTWGMAILLAFNVVAFVVDVVLVDFYDAL